MIWEYVYSERTGLPAWVKPLNLNQIDTRQVQADTFCTSLMMISEEGAGADSAMGFPENRVDIWLVDRASSN